MVDTKRLVLDVLKPHDPGIREFATETARCDGVDGVNAALVETDREVQNVKITVEGEAIDSDDVEATVEDLGGTIHSIDEVVAGDVVVEESATPQDA
ncbi:DUF211 domain-containing protein [Halorubellus sp. JP-L1]|uniref:DUF211 domain-containing protein n=1 Tax=Halorubellus sp. JP-L1 TaxID=2715753 RepID=UPI00140CE72E|nr:DUF211 domain-containing protein [Halorubellus sp. JP-L1]NHN43147.1 DUF211 domain-containing protein [Halorubellus sp. JP-L1]